MISIFGNSISIKENYDKYGKKPDELCYSLQEYLLVPPEYIFNTIHYLTHSARLLCLITPSINLHFFDYPNSSKKPHEISQLSSKIFFTEKIFMGLVLQGFWNMRIEKSETR